MSSQSVTSSPWIPFAQLESSSNPESQMNKLLFLQEKLISNHGIKIPTMIKKDTLFIQLRFQSAQPVPISIAIPDDQMETSSAAAAAADTDSRVESNGSSMKLSDLDMRITTLQMSIININESTPRNELVESYNELASIKRVLDTIQDNGRDAIVDQIDKKLHRFLNKDESARKLHYKALMGLRNSSIGKKRATPGLTEKLKAMDLDL